MHLVCPAPTADHALLGSGWGVCGLPGMGSCTRRSFAATLPWDMFLLHVLLQPGPWCAACAACWCMCRDCSRLQINDWLWLGKLSWSDSSPSYNNGYIGPGQWVWGGWGNKCIFNYNCSILEWKMCTFVQLKTRAVSNKVVLHSEELVYFSSGVWKRGQISTYQPWQYLLQPLAVTPVMV